MNTQLCTSDNGGNIMYRKLKAGLQGSIGCRQLRCVLKTRKINQVLLQKKCDSGATCSPTRVS